ncbi:MAG: hypothetical protein RL095_4135 [Verrucomicrobiota bacterium]|jgi:transcription elongation factor Elf1
MNDAPQKLRILSYIRNFRKVVFTCPRCQEPSSVQLNADLSDCIRPYRCDNCRLKIQIDLGEVRDLDQQVEKFKG